MISSEIFPFAKAGGLGDVVPQLSEELARSGHEVKVLMPRYGSIETADLERLPFLLEPTLAGRTWSTAVYRYVMDGGAELYFLDQEELFASRGMYVDEAGQDYPDNLCRFGLLSKAVFPLCRSLAWQPDVIHGHDWHAALAMTWLRGERQNSAHFAGTISVFTIHNIGYQGIFDYGELPVLGLSEADYRGLGFEYYGKICLLRSALYCADRISTVSPTYAREILSDTYGFGMQDILRERSSRLSGILNGADYSVWDPGSDELIPHRYDGENIGGKGLNKADVQAEYGLELSEDRPLVGIVSRLVTQKGFAVLLGDGGENLRRILSGLDLQLVVLGSGEPWIEEAFRSIAAEQENLGLLVGYDETMSHRIQAASDFFLVPSLYEPCGLTQIYALRYGSLPVVSRTGGLLDTVVDIDENPASGTGILINKTNETPPEQADALFSGEDIFQALRRALALWQDRQRYLETQQRAMGQRFGWKEAGTEYLRMYEEGRRQPS